MIVDDVVIMVSCGVKLGMKIIRYSFNLMYSDVIR